MIVKPPYSTNAFMKKNIGGPQFSGFMAKYPQIIRGSTIQMPPSMSAAMKNKIERKR